MTTIEASALAPPDHARRYALVELARIDALPGWPERDLWGRRIPRPDGPP